MRYLPAVTRNLTPAVHVTYGLPDKFTRPELPRPAETRSISRRVPGQTDCLDLPEGSAKQSLDGFPGNSLETFISSFLANPSKNDLRDQQIAAYRRAERILYTDAEMSFRFVDLYV